MPRRTKDKDPSIDSQKGEKSKTRFISISYFLRRYREDNRTKLSLYLAILGLSSILIAEIANLNDDLRIIAFTLGATFIVSSISAIIASLNEEEYQKLFDQVIGQGPEDHKKIYDSTNQIITDIIYLKKNLEEIRQDGTKFDLLNSNLEKNKDEIISIVKNTLSSKLELAEEASRCGIVRIFRCRHKDEGYELEIMNQLKNMVRDKNRQQKTEILMMANSFRDFFGAGKHKYYDEINKLINANVSFRIILLDPLSDAASNRAFIEEGIKPSEYLKSSLFQDIESVSQKLHKLILNNKKSNINMEVRFSPFAPTTYLIITDKYTFVEQYHIGGDNSIKQCLVEKGIASSCDCFGGFAPIMMYENSCFFSSLMRSHFENTWNSDSVVNKDLIKHDYISKIEKFKSK